MRDLLSLLGFVVIGGILAFFLGKLEGRITMAKY